MRIDTVRGFPNSWIVASPSPNPPTLLRMRPRSAGCPVVTRTIWPPMKSTPRLSPRVATSAIDAIVSSTDSSSARLRHRMKSMLVLSGTSLRRRMALSRHIRSSRGRALRSHSATIIRVTLTAVNTDVTMPIISTTAKPRIGPEPK